MCNNLPESAEEDQQLQNFREHVERQYYKCLLYAHLLDQLTWDNCLQVNQDYEPYLQCEVYHQLLP